MQDSTNKKILYVFFADCNIFSTAKLMSSLGYSDKQKLHLCFESEYTRIVINTVF